jgi:hypothetical protein
MTLSLQQISDRLEIEDLVYCYSQAIDQQAFDVLDTVFTADAFVDYSAMGGAKGSYPEVKAFLQGALPGLVDYYHMVGNIRLQLDGDRATGRVMCFNPMGVPMPQQQGPHMMFLGLFYVDEYVRTDAGWRIARRVEERSWGYNVPDWIATGQ